ncbi:MAG: response regulator transcription factor [Lachnospiraceae bacterium]|nr:response regulator transcription factor [Lachnospiraceae bacterium]
MNLLLIEDDEKLCETLKYQLEQEQFSVDCCYDGFTGLNLLLSGSYDLAVLDRMLPSMDGLQVLREVRTQGVQTPVVLLTALGELQDKITGLDYGADDYIVKPFAFEELAARIRCIVRRVPELQEHDELKFGDLQYDTQQNILACRGKSCTLSRREGDLMELFLRNPRQTLPRGVILSRVWGSNSEVEEGNLDNYIHFIRRRLKTVGSQVNLKTMRGIGYRLEESYV